MTDPIEDELWQVAVSPGDTRTMTLEQLDAAFDHGLINESTLIAEQGTQHWQPLYIVAGLEPPTQEAVQPPTSVGPETVPKPPEAAPAAAPKASRAAPKPALPRAGGVASPSGIPRPGPPRPGASAAPAGIPRPDQPRKRTPSFLETAAAVVAEAGTAPKKSLPPPLPPNAFSHLAAQAIAEAKAPQPPALVAPEPQVPPEPAAAPAATAPPITSNDEPAPLVASAPPGPPPMPSGAPPLPGSMPSNAPAPGFAVPPVSAPPGVLAPPGVSAPPGVPGLTPSAIPPAAPAPTPSPSGAPPLPQNAFSHLSSSASAITEADELADFTPATKTAGAWTKQEWLVLGIAALLGVLMILQRNGTLHGLSSAVGAESAYLGFEGAVLGEPSINTERGVRRFVEGFKKPDKEPGKTGDTASE